MRRTRNRSPLQSRAQCMRAQRTPGAFFPIFYANVLRVNFGGVRIWGQFPRARAFKSVKYVLDARRASSFNVFVKQINLFYTATTSLLIK